MGEVEKLKAMGMLTLTAGLLGLTLNSWSSEGSVFFVLTMLMSFAIIPGIPLGIVSIMIAVSEEA